MHQLRANPIRVSRFLLWLTAAAVVSVAGWCLPSSASEKPEIADAERTGIELQGRSKDDPPPDRWYITDAKTGKQVVKVQQRWGLAPVPAGEYIVSLLPKGYKAIEVVWSTIKVDEGKTVAIDVTSGIELEPASEKAEPPEWWYVTDPKTEKQVAKIHQRWGFTPLPPGEYLVSVQPKGFQAIEVVWSKVKVEQRKVAPVEVKSGVELVPRDTGDKPSEWWSVTDLKTQKQVAKVHQRWGFTPLPPGDYEVLKLPLQWSDVKVTEGQVVRLAEPAPPDRLASLTGVGRQSEKERDPEAYKKLEEEIERAIRRAAAWVKRHPLIAGLSADGSDQDGYPTLGILALVHAGEFERDPELARRGSDYLARRPLSGSYATYATSLTAMGLRDLDAFRFRNRIFECGQWLVENQGWNDARKVWGYGDKVSGIGEPKKAEKPVSAAAKAAGSAPKPAGAGRRRGGASLEIVRRGLVAHPRAAWDNSNTQFAVLGLHSTASAGIKLPRDVWSRIEEHFRAIQREDGGWPYSGSRSTGSMTCAGAAALLISRYHLGETNPALDSAVLNGLGWLAANFTVNENPYNKENHYYFLYGLERVGILAGTEFLGRHEWYPTGARYLLAEQLPDGSWKSRNGPPSGHAPDYLDTCYAILFLRRATLPLEPASPAFLTVSGESGRVPAAMLPAVELILDSSGSMRELVGGEPKNKIARRVVSETLEKLAGDVQVGLRLFGHWGVYLPQKKDPKAAPLSVDNPQLNRDSELVVPIGLLDDRKRAKIAEWLDWAIPRGKTPLVYSLLEARGDFPAGLTAPRTVVLVSDGEETCGGKLESVAEAYRDSKIDVLIHVVGFDVKETAAEQELREIARIGRGNYYSADSAEKLSAALHAVVQGIAFEVLDAAGSAVIATGEVNGDELTLKPGRYQVRLSRSQIEPLAIELKAGQTLDLTLGENGTLSPGR